MLPRFKDLDPETRDFIAPLLPSSAADFIRIIGLEATLSLVAAFGGVDIRVPRQPDGPAAERFAELAGVIGHDNLIRLGTEFSGNEQIYIPRCFRAMGALRNREIIAEYSKMIQSTSCRQAASELALRYKTSSRSIEKIVNGKQRPSRSQTQKEESK